MPTGTVPGVSPLAPPPGVVSPVVPPGATGATGDTGATGATGGGPTPPPGPGGGGAPPVAGPMGTAGQTPIAPDPTGPEPAPTGPAGGGAGPGPTPAPVAGGAGAPVDPGPVVPAVPEPTLVTSAANAFWTVGEVTEMPGAAATVTVDEGQMYQEWLGFGGTFNEKGWDALAVLPEAERERALKLLFDKVDGAGFTFGRIPLGSSDYGMDRYTLAETPGDYEMASFSIDRDKEMLIPYIQAALAIKPDIQFWASPWTPPPWMKDNNAYDRGYMIEDAQTLGAYALYFVKFVQAYAAEGINITAVHPQNEPGWQQDYPSCGWSNAGMIDFIANHLGPAVEAELPGTEVWMGTMSNGDLDNAIAEAVMANGAAAAYVKGIGLQWEMETHAQRYTSTYNVPILQTEHKCGNYPWESGTDQSRAPNDFAYGQESWGLLTSWITKGVHGYVAWNMVLDTIGRSLDEVRPWAQNALLAVDRQSGTLNVTPAYYVFRHVAQYVEPGAVRIGVNGDALAFKNPDGSIVTIIHNTTGSASPTTLSVAGTTLQFEIPASGWATVNWGG
jgi:glucosylceramidase